MKPVHPTPKILRADDWLCVMQAPGALRYEQGGIVRPIENAFPCPAMGDGKMLWGSGTREIVVEYADDDEVAIVEVWP